MAEMMRIPTVLVVQQRGGPSTATVIYSQQEVTITCYGANGEGFRIVYSTSNHQELFDYTIKSFNTAWKYRFPTFVLGDGYQAKMREPVTMYDPEERGIVMEPTTPFVGGPGLPGTDREPSLLRNTYNTEDELLKVVNDMAEEYAKIAPEVIEYQEFDTDDAEVLVVAHGVVTRAAQAAIKELRAKGIKAGHFRPITIRPFPDEQLRKVADRAKTILVVESAVGQFKKLVVDAIYGCSTPLETLYKPGEGITSDEIVERVQKIQG